MTEARDNDGNTPLHTAAIVGDRIVFDLISTSLSTRLEVNKESKASTLCNKRGETPLMVAIQHNNKQCIDALIVDPVYSQTLTHVNNLGMTSFYIAAYAGNLHVMDTMVKAGVDVRQCDLRGNSPLHAAASQGHLEVIKLLIDRKWADVKAINQARWTPLHWAACNGRTEACKLLVSYGAELNAGGSAEETACYLAYNRRHLDTFKTMLLKLKTAHRSL